MIYKKKSENVLTETIINEKDEVAISVEKDSERKIEEMKK